MKTILPFLFVIVQLQVIAQCDKPIIYELSTNTPCVGSDLNLSVSATPVTPAVSLTYAWAGPMSFTSSQQSPLRSAATTAMSGIYTVTVTDNVGCFTTTTVLVIVSPIPIVYAGKGQSICKGANTTLTAASDVRMFAWENGPTTASYTVTPTSSPTIYTVTATNYNGCSNKAEVTVTFNPIPTASLPNDFSICGGNDTSVTVLGNGIKFIWNDDANTATQTLNLTPTYSKTYTVTITTKESCTATADIVINVNKLSSATTMYHQNCKDGVISLSSILNSNYSYKWSASSGGVIINPTQNNTDVSYCCPNSLIQDTTVLFYLTVTDNKTQCIETSNIEIVFESICKPHVYIDKTDTILCKGENFILKTYNSNILGTPSYQWSDASLIGSGPFTIKAPSTTQTYTVTITTAENSTATANVVIKVNPLPTALIGGTLKICQNNFTDLSVSNTGYNGVKNLHWSSAGGTTQPFRVTPLTTTDYSVTITDNNNCSAQATAKVTVNPLPIISFPDFKWPLCLSDTVFTLKQASSLPLPGTGVYSGKGVSDINFNASIAGIGSHAITYTFTDANTCKNSDTKNITVLPLPVEPAVPPAICLKQSGLLDANNAGAYFTWSTGETIQKITVMPYSAGTIKYTVTVVAGGCTALNAVSLVVNPIPTATISTNNTSICKGASVLLSALGTNPFVWNTTETTAKIKVMPTHNTVYTVTVSANGCTDTESVSITTTDCALESMDTLNSYKELEKDIDNTFSLTSIDTCLFDYTQPIDTFYINDFSIQKNKAYFNFVFVQKNKTYNISTSVNLASVVNGVNRINLKVTCTKNKSTYSNTFVATYDVILQSIHEQTAFSKSFTVSPNPFNQTLTVKINKQQTETSINVFDALGRDVTSLFTNNTLTNNVVSIWDTEHVPSGVYFIQVQNELGKEVIRVVK